MATCKDCLHYNVCDYVSIVGKTCKDFKDRTKWVEKKQTMINADRIRAMSDDELAKFINKIVVNHHIKNADNCAHCPIKDAKPCDTEGMLDWLRNPAESKI